MSYAKAIELIWGMADPGSDDEDFRELNDAHKVLTGELHVIAMGDPFNGITLYGPFTLEEAIRFGEETGEQWFVMPLKKEV